MRKPILALVVLAVLLPLVSSVLGSLARSRQDRLARELSQGDPLRQERSVLLSSPPGARVSGSAQGVCPLVVPPGSYRLSLPGWSAELDYPGGQNRLVELKPSGPFFLRYPLETLAALCAAAALGLGLRQRALDRQAEETAGVFPGGRVGPYELAEKLGEGAMAEVYRARHRKSGQVRALKILTEVTSQDPELRQRFEREVGLCADTLRHPHIVGFYERGEAYGRLWTAMDLVEGGNLGDRIGTTGLPPAEIRRWLAQLCNALAYAHGQGVFHRDLKPENLLVSDTTLRVADFGLARGGHYPRITVTGTTLGTPAYMPPEQVGGELPPDGRGDMYSVGCILFEMLTGRTPFVGDPIEMIVAHVSGEPPAPSSVKSGLDPELEALAVRLLDKDPARRYTAAELARLLRASPLS